MELAMQSPIESMRAGQQATRIAATDGSFQTDDTDRVVLHIDDGRHYIVLCESDGVTRVYDADEDGEIGSWIAHASGFSLEDAIEKLAAFQDLPSHDLLTAVVQVRVSQRLQRARLARGRPAPTRPGFIYAPLAGDGSPRPGPSLHMGRTSKTASTPGKPAELALDFAPEVNVGPSTDVRPTTLESRASGQMPRLVAALAGTR
jgi:hypothetical protein